MTQEDKELLLKDLCARLPYRVVINCTEEDDERTNFNCFLVPDIFKDIKSETAYWIIKPYLRPMSSMTDEEREELSDYLCEKVMSNKIGITIPPNPTQGKGIPFIWMGDCLDWLNKHHFDYRGLIEKGLALEAPENMYNI